MIDWNQKIPAPADRIPDLNAVQFGFVLASPTAQGNFLEDILDAVLLGLKTGTANLPPNHEGYRTAKSLLGASRFVFTDVLSIVANTHPYRADLFPNEDISEAFLKALWLEAAAA